MNKIKSAIITVLLVAAVVVLAGFATISCNLSDGVKRYNSFITSIHMGSEFTGSAYTLLYPEGTISASKYERRKLDKEGDELTKYEDKYEPLSGGKLYIEKEQLGAKYDEDTERYTPIDESKITELANSVAADAKVLTKRFSEKAYSGYSVSIVDGYCIKITAPTRFTYAAYREHDASSRSTELSRLSFSITYLTYARGDEAKDMDLRDGTSYDDSNSIFNVNEDCRKYFKSASLYSMGGTNAVRIKLTNEGLSRISKLMKDRGDDDKAYFYIGENCLGLTIDKGLQDKTLMFAPDGFSKSNVQDIAILLNSVISGESVTNVYEYENDGIVAVSADFGEYAAIYLAVVMLLAVVAAVVFSIVKYKKLGLVNALIAVMYSLVIICALMLLEIELTMAGAFTILLGLALLTFTNFRVFEAVRKETQSGRTVQASVKTGYKKTLSTILDLHIVLVVISILFAFVGVGEIASCGLIFLIASLASYILYWFTRFMWYVISTPCRDKFKFCGFVREDFDDED